MTDQRHVMTSLFVSVVVCLYWYFHDITAYPWHNKCLHLIYLTAQYMYRNASHEERLLAYLFVEYDPVARPTMDTSQTVNVSIEFVLLRIHGLVRIITLIESINVYIRCLYTTFRCQALWYKKITCRLSYFESEIIKNTYLGSTLCILCGMMFR